MNLTRLYKALQRVTESGEARTLMLHKCLYTSTIHNSTPPIPPMKALHPDRHTLAHQTYTSTDSFIFFILNLFNVDN